MYVFIVAGYVGERYQVLLLLDYGECCLEREEEAYVYIRDDGIFDVGAFGVLAHTANGHAVTTAACSDADFDVCWSGL